MVNGVVQIFYIIMFLPLLLLSITERAVLGSPLVFADLFISPFNAVCAGYICLSRVIRYTCTYLWGCGIFRLNGALGGRAGESPRLHVHLVAGGHPCQSADLTVLSAWSGSLPFKTLPVCL